MQKNKVYFLALSALFTAVMVICALITLPAPVPFTLQTLGVFAAALFLGTKGALASVAAYILLGAVGLPVFSGMQGGVGVLFGPTGGYIFGFILIPLINGILSAVLSKKYQPLYLLAGLLACYIFGSIWYMLYADVKSFWTVLIATVLPFILPDILKLIVALRLVKMLKAATERLLPEDPDRLSRHMIKRNISKDIEVCVFDEIDSTNSEAVRRLKADIVPPALFVAERQTAGRGRRGRSFHSSGGGLYMTLALKSSPSDTVGLTALAAVAVAETIENLTGISAGIKWVNDIYIDGKKVCGILCEAVADNQTGEMSAVIIGIGINLRVKAFPEELRNVAGNIDCKSLSKNLLAANITNRILELINSDEDYISTYKQKSIVLGKDICYIKNGVKYEAVAADIEKNGGLTVINTDGTTEILNSGEITLRIK